METCKHSSITQKGPKSSPEKLQANQFDIRALKHNGKVRQG